MPNKYLLIAVAIFLNITYSVGQDSTHANVNKESIPFYKWEIGIDVLPLIDKAKDPFGYILKRNFQSASGRQALRLKILPKWQYTPLIGGDSYAYSINLAIGYEWQKLYNHFAILYGFDPYFQRDQIKISGNQVGVITEQNTLKVGVSGFIGGRYYLGKHIAVTLESHLFYQYYDTKMNNYSPNNPLGSAFTKYHSVYFNPINTVYLSYHF